MHDQCRAVIVTESGQEIPTRWRPVTPYEKLGPDEFPVMHRLVKAAERYAKRKGFKRYSVAAQYRTKS